MTIDPELPAIVKCLSIKKNGLPSSYLNRPDSTVDCTVADQDHCVLCGKPILWGITPYGKYVALEASKDYESMYVPHAMTCSASRAFRDACRDPKNQTTAQQLRAGKKAAEMAAQNGVDNRRAQFDAGWLLGCFDSGRWAYSADQIGAHYQEGYSRGYKAAETIWGRPAAPFMTATPATLDGPASIPPALWKFMIRNFHPDRYVDTPDFAMANEVTKWLLENRPKEKVA